METVQASELKPGPIRHDELSAAQIERLTKLHETFRDVDPTPLAKWIDDFKRDANPEREISIYEAMAHAYSAYCTGRNLGLDAKGDDYRVVLARSMAPDEQVLKTVRLQALSLEDAKEILKNYDTPAEPISVTSPQ